MHHRKEIPANIPSAGHMPRISTPAVVSTESEAARTSFTTTNDAYAHNIYRGVLEDGDINRFLEETDSYDLPENKWSIPDSPTSTGELLGSVYKVFSSVVQRFVRPEEHGVNRHTINTRDSQPGKVDIHAERHNVPRILIQAAGPSFETPSDPQSTLASTESHGCVGYSNVASFAVVKLESELGTAADNLEEAESYARQIFQAQPNRAYVRALILTEKHARLLHFDHAGFQVTPLIDIHKNAPSLVRLITGLSSTDERLLGLDDSVQWTIVDGKKSQGHLTTTGPTGETVTYPIVEQIPIPRDTILSRATTCWRVKDPKTSENYVVKDSWREDNLPPEHELLEHVKGIPGVVHMVSFEADRGEVRLFRCPSTTCQYQNRTASRVMMKAYGKSVEYFRSILQVLYAFRDAIAAHQHLVERGILHRDISLNNILLGEDDSPEGERGVLIDLDMAFRATDTQPTTKTDHTIGTRLFQSIHVLHSCELKERAFDHDYLDDLEAFIYVFSFIVLCYRPDGSPIPTKEEGPSLVWSWAQEVPSSARARKHTFFGAGTLVFRSFRLVQSTWGPACGDLFNKFRRWIFQMRNKKATLIATAVPGGETNPLESLHSSRAEHYSTVIAMFDAAIDAVRLAVASPSNEHKEEVNPPSTPVKRAPGHASRLPGSATALVTPPAAQMTVPPPPATPLSPNRKRRSTEVAHPDAPQNKRRPTKGPACSP